MSHSGSLYPSFDFAEQNSDSRVQFRPVVGGLGCSIFYACMINMFIYLSIWVITQTLAVIYLLLERDLELSGL